MQEDLLFKDEIHTRKLQQNYKDRWFQIYVLLAKHKRLTNQTPDSWGSLSPLKTHKSEVFSLFKGTPDFCSASLDLSCWQALNTVTHVKQYVFWDTSSSESK